MSLALVPNIDPGPALVVSILVSLILFSVGLAAVYGLVRLAVRQELDRQRKGNP